MRSRNPEARLEVRRKLRSLLWRAWRTRPQFEPPPLTVFSSASGIRAVPAGLQILGPRSLRDEYILARAGAFHTQAYGTHGHTKAIWSWLRRKDLTHPIHTLGARIFLGRLGC